MFSLNICHLYPDLLNLYGDRGNVITMVRRLQWRGIQANVHNITVNDDFNYKEYDIVFIGGGQDFEQGILLDDIKKNKRELIIEAVENDVVFLAICGGYQLLGSHYITWENKEYEFIGAIDIYTIGKKERMIGDFLFQCPEILNGNSFIAGFENHSGKTYLGSSVKPLGKIIKGKGNNGEDGYEGARYKNVFCSYSHGSLLPKNPDLCDLILSKALERKYNEFELEKLNDNFEVQANSVIKNKLI